MIRLLHTVLFIAIAFVINLKTETKVSDTSIQRNNVQWKNLSKSEYSIKYPDNWELNQSGIMGTSFVIFSPQESDSDKYKENVTLIIQDLKGQKFNLDKYVELSLNQFTTLLTNPMLIENIRVKTSKKEFHKIIYSFVQGTLHLKTEQYLFVLNDKAYVLTLSTTPETFDQYKSLGEKMLDSFTVK